MWIFTPVGLVMPATFPVDKVSTAISSKYDLQVRARARDHLVKFRRRYMRPGTYSAIQATPEMDYQFRFYTTHVAFAFAMTKAVLEIDYEKFKPQATEPHYHQTLNQLWAVLYRTYSEISGR